MKLKTFFVTMEGFSFNQTKSAQLRGGGPTLNYEIENMI